MTGLVRKATLLTACGLVLAGAAMAGVPNSANSTLGGVQVTDYDIVTPALAQENGIQSHAAITMTIIRDADNFPVPFATVTVDFSTCGTDVEMAEIQPDPAATVNCGAETITIQANAAGEVFLGPFLARTAVNVPGWPDDPGSTPIRNIGPAEPISCATIYAGGFIMGMAVVLVNRFNGDPNDTDVDAGDQAFHENAQGQFFDPFTPPIPQYRIFYDHDNDLDVDAGDGALVLVAQNLFFGGRAVYTGPWCGAP